MMKKYLWIIAVLSCSLSGFSQGVDVQLNAPLFENTNIKLNDLLQFHVNSAEDNIISSTIEIDIASEDGQVVLLRTGVFRLNQGLSIGQTLVGFNANRMNLVTARRGFKSVQSNDFIFPIGKYSYCVTLKDIEGKVLERACHAFESSTTLSFFLVYPYDEQVLKEDRPVFTWTPLIGGNNQNIKYRIRWSENKEEINNPNQFYAQKAFLNLKDIDENLLPYGLEYPAFDQSKSYYWQVEAYDNNKVIARSDVWSFNFAAQKAASPEISSYLVIDHHQNEYTHVFTSDTLAFYWEVPYDVSTIEYQVMDRNNTQMLTQANRPVEIVSNKGNYCYIVLNNAIQKNKTYSLVLKGLRKNYKIRLKRVDP